MKRFLFPILSATLVPIVVLLLIEGVLRLLVVSPSTDFFIAVPESDSPDLQTNPAFATQFFPAAMARLPRPARIVMPKPENTVRILLLGGSAAMGEPEPTFGVGRHLRVILEARHPDRRFEVINGAMATVNSHVVYQIAREVGRIDPDVVVVYVGNNEVVGPFGAGTVFGNYSPRLSMIRLGIALRKTRVGQLISHVLGQVTGRSAIPEGQGMSLFTEQRVRHDDPRLEKVYAHFEENLRDIARAVETAGAKLVISTVATNLADHPPFMSTFDAQDVDRLRLWNEAYMEGQALIAVNDTAGAIDAFSRALAIDDAHAGLHYHLSQLVTDRRAAGTHAIRARDLDALRFRADSAVNATIQSVAGEMGAVLVEGEKELIEAFDGLPGRKVFYEHVHLTFAGNHTLGRALASGVGAAMGARSSGSDLGVETTAQALAWTPWDRYRAWAGISGLMGKPPFTLWEDYVARRRALNRQVADLRRMGMTQPALGSARAAYEARRSQHPSDVGIRENYARLLHELGDFVGAARVWQELLDVLPAPAWRIGLATALSAQGAHQAAIAQYRAVQRDLPGLVLVNIQIGYDLVASGRLEEAVEELEQGLVRSPGSTILRLNLASILADLGLTERAEIVLAEAIEMMTLLGNRSAEAELYVGQAEMLAERDPDASLLALYKAQRRFSAAKDHASEVDVLLRTASLNRTQGRFEEAETSYAYAIEICGEMQMTELQARATAEHAFSALEQGDATTAQHRLRKARDLYAATLADHPALSQIDRILSAESDDGS